MSLTNDIRAALSQRGCHVMSGDQIYIRGTLPNRTLLYLVCLKPGEPLSHRRKRHIDAHARVGEVAAVVRSLDDVRQLLDREGVEAIR